MDDIVKQAMNKWPNVPHCYGWLGLDMRGHWHMRDDDAQAHGAFASGRSGAKGSLLQHEKLIEFIHRNYAEDELGQWFFQNGPQRVYVELELTPWVWRVSADASVMAQTGNSAQYEHCLSDELGRVYLQTSLGIGLVHSADVPTVAQLLDARLWALEALDSAELSQRYGFIASPELQQSLLPNL
jgi:hypothetical protein